MLLQYSDTSLEIPSLVGAMYSEKNILVNRSSTNIVPDDIIRFLIKTQVFCSDYLFMCKRSNLRQTIAHNKMAT